MSLVMTFLYGLFIGGAVFVVPAIVPQSAYVGAGRRLEERFDRGGADRAARLADQISDFYVNAAMTVLGRALMVIRSNGGQVLKRSSYDTQSGGEKVKMGGAEKKWRNPDHMMHTLSSRPFGFVMEDRDVIFDIRTAHMTEKYHGYREAGEWMVDGARRAYATVAEGPTLVDIRTVTVAVQSSASPELADRIDSFVEKMESMFNSSNAWDYLPWVIASGLGLGLMWFAAKLSTTTSGSVGVPI